jgi:hypothetical protein
MHSKQLLLQLVLVLPEGYELLELVSVLLSVFHEGVLEQLFSVGSLFRVLVETPCHEVLEAGRPLLALESWRIFCHNEEEDLLLRLGDIGRLSVSKFKSENTEAPDVDLAVILRLAFDEFRSHPANCAYFA